MEQQPVSLRGVQLLPGGPSSPLLLMSNCLLCVPVRDSPLTGSERGKSFETKGCRRKPFVSPFS